MNQPVRKTIMTLAVLAPFLAALFIASQLFDLRKAVDDLRVWAIHALGGNVAQPQAPEQPAQAPASGEAGKQMEKAYSELVKELAPQVIKEQVRIEKSQGKLEIRLMEQVVFDSGSAKLTREGQDVLAKTGQALVAIKDRSFSILGHTDNIPISGLYPSNWELSTARACAVVRFLSERSSIDPKRFYAVGRADCDPVADNATEAGRTKNRRVEILATDMECLAVPSRAGGQ